MAVAVCRARTHPRFVESWFELRGGGREFGGCRSTLGQSAKLRPETWRCHPSLGVGACGLGHRIWRFPQDLGKFCGAFFRLPSVGPGRQAKCAGSIDERHQGKKPLGFFVTLRGLVSVPMVVDCVSWPP